MQAELNYFVQLEARIWEALKNADAGVENELLAECFQGVYASGLSDKAGHMAQLDSGPTVRDYQILQPQIQRLEEDLVLLLYRANWWRIGAVSELPDTYYISSLWQQRGGFWQCVFSQDTEVANVLNANIE